MFYFDHLDPGEGLSEVYPAAGQHRPGQHRPGHAERELIQQAEGDILSMSLVRKATFVENNVAAMH